MRQLSRLVEVSGGLAPAGAPFPEDRVTVQAILGPSRNLMPPLATTLLGGAGLALGGWPGLILAPAAAMVLFGRRFDVWSWRWADRRARLELQAALPRFARTRLAHFDGGAARLGGNRYAATGIALATDGARTLLIVENGIAARIPWALLRGWGEEADGLWVEAAWPEKPRWRFTCADPARVRAWGAHLGG